MRKTVLAMLSVAGATILAPLPALAWDYPGHRIVGAIADLVLQQHYPHTRKKVSALLDIKDTGGTVIDKRSLSEVAVFPDCAKDEEEYCRRRPSAEEIAYVLRNLGHKSYHYTNSPLGENLYKPRGVGTADNDVVQMMKHAIRQLQKERVSKFEVNLTNTEALWLLAHLVGDLHQPLHISQIYYDKTCQNSVNPNEPANRDALTTLGGNLIKFAPTAPAVSPAPSLHIYWDATTIARAMHAAGRAGDEEGFARMLAAAPPVGQTAGAPDTWAEQWVAEAIPIARKAYADANIVGKLDSGRCSWTVTLDENYENWAQKAASEQLAKAGFRLAALLVAIFPNKEEATSPPPP